MFFTSWDQQFEIVRKDHFRKIVIVKNKKHTEYLINNFLTLFLGN